MIKFGYYSLYLVSNIINKVNLFEVDWIIACADKGDELLREIDRRENKLPFLFFIYPCPNILPYPILKYLTL